MWFVSTKHDYRLPIPYRGRDRSTQSRLLGERCTKVARANLQKVYIRIDNLGVQFCMRRIGTCGKSFIRQGHQPQTPAPRGLLRTAAQALVVALLATAPVVAQNAEISGLISDPAGRAVAGARVVVQSESTGARRAVSSNQSGEYAVTSLLPGAYEIAIEANGFKTIQQNGVLLEVDQRARLDFALTVGSTTETITVEGSVSLLNQSDASVSTVIGNRFVENMPLNGAASARSSTFRQALC
jgi:hypothetical protein